MVEPQDRQLVRHNVIELQLAQPPARFRYGSNRFRRDIVVALFMTVLLSILVFMMAIMLGLLHPLLIASLSAFAFFLFISAASIYRYVRREVILAITPTGLSDRRLGTGLILWEQVRDLAVSPREGEAILKLALWKDHKEHGWGKRGEPLTDKGNRAFGAGSTTTDYIQLDLSQLDAEPEIVLAAISRYRPVRFDHDSQKLVGH